MKLSFLTDLALIIGSAVSLLIILRVWLGDRKRRHAKSLKVWLESIFEPYDPITTFLLKVAVIGGALGLLLVFLAVVLHDIP